MSAHTRPESPGGLVEIDQRSREIFRQIVDGYLTTGEPVGSRNIARLLPMALSPATVRNVMTDLEMAGLIYAPHTSAGRLPTERGLRFFVDGMMEVGNLVDAALAGFDRREAVTIPPLHDAGQWDAFQAARQAMIPGFATVDPAPRYTSAA